MRLVLALLLVCTSCDVFVGRAVAPPPCEHGKQVGPPFPLLNAQGDTVAWGYVTEHCP